MEENKNIQNDEITLKELILKVQEYFFEVLKSWLLIILITLPIMGYMFYKSYSPPFIYSAELTFMVNDDEGGGASGGLMGLAASFGFGGKGEYNYKKILSLLKSRNIIQQALFEKIKINEKEDYIANHLIEEYKFEEEWKEDNSDLVGFRFSSPDFLNFELRQNGVLKKLHSLVVGVKGAGGILQDQVDKETQIMTLKLNSTNEELSIKFVTILFDKLQEFYVTKTIEKQKQDFNLTKFKVDSLRGALSFSQQRLLKLEDTNQRVILKQYKAEELKLKFQIQALAMAYAEAMKGQEIADFRLKSKTPFIQIIDTPISPIYPKRGLITYIKSLITGGIIGVFLAVLIILGRKILRDTLKN